MKKIFILCFYSFFLLSKQTMAGCIIEGCFSPKEPCAENEIADMDGKCHSCFEKDPIKICPWGKGIEEAKKKCPNRYLGLSNHFSFSEKTKCPENHFMADDAKCYPCDYDKSVKTSYLGDKLSDICPNRLWTVCDYSVAKCPSEHTLDGKTCIRNCAQGYVETRAGKCIHSESGQCYIRSFDGDDLGCSHDYLTCKKGYTKTKYGECLNSIGDCYTEDSEGKIIKCTFAHE